jgi:hypothetical protein
MAGPMFVLLFWWVSDERDHIGRWFRKPAVALSLTAVFVIAFGVGREREIYRERSVDELTQPLGDVLSVGGHIRTNDTTYAMMRELTLFLDEAKASGRPSAVIPGVAAVWIDREYSNPLPMDWIHPVAVSNREIRDRILHVLDAERDRLVVIVQTVDPRHLAWRTEPLEVGDLESILQFVQDHFRPTRVGRFHTVYETRTSQPAWSVTPNPRTNVSLASEQSVR